MIPQLDPTETRYLAEIIVSILGVLLFFALAVWMIRRKQNTKPTEAISAPNTTSPYSESHAVTLADFCSSTPAEQAERSSTLEQTYRNWKNERLLHAEDGRSMFLRTGVEKNGMRYQLVASTQVQALAILVSTLMSQNDPLASITAEALFANLLAHPAYGQSELSSWKYLPDLPRSPKLDPDPHAEAWVIYSLLTATRRWSELNRFSYPEIILEKTEALQNYIKTLEPELSRGLPFSGYLVKQLMTSAPGLDWSCLDDSRELVSSLLEESDWLDSEFDASHLGLSLLQLGMLALLERDSDALLAIQKGRHGLMRLVENSLNNSTTQPEFSRTAMLSCTVPALLTLEDRELNARVWNELISMQPDKNDGLGATLKMLAMAFLANQKFQHFCSQDGR